MFLLKKKSSSWRNYRWVFLYVRREVSRTKGWEPPGHETLIRLESVGASSRSADAPAHLLSGGHEGQLSSATGPVRHLRTLCMALNEIIHVPQYICRDAGNCFPAWAGAADGGLIVVRWKKKQVFKTCDWKTATEGSETTQIIFFDSEKRRVG